MDDASIEDEIVRLRCLDYSAYAIAKTVGVSQKRVQNVLDRENERHAASREQMRQQKRLELAWLKRPLKRRMEADEASGRGVSREDIAVILKVIEQERRLDGLDAPVQLDVRTVEAMSDDDLQKELSRYGVNVKQLAAPTATPATEAVADAEFEVKTASTEEPTP